MELVTSQSNKHFFWLSLVLKDYFILEFLWNST